jgi:hypothetical protein
MIAGQIADLSEQVETSYQLGADTVTISAGYHAQTLALAGKVTAGTLVVTGHDLTGRPVSLTAPVPAGAILSIPGIVGSIALVERLAGMKLGATRTLTSLELGYFPAIAITAGRTRVERKPDRGGRRVFAIAATQGEATVPGELVVDADGSVVAQTLGAPVNTSFTRRPQ